MAKTNEELFDRLMNGLFNPPGQHQPITRRLYFWPTRARPTSSIDLVGPTQPHAELSVFWLLYGKSLH
jgi:hypothetical protein